MLPTHVDRWAITLWYFDRDEYDGARRLRKVHHSVLCGTDFVEVYVYFIVSYASPSQDVESESFEAEAIENEIQRFENRFGGRAVRH